MKPCPWSDHRHCVLSGRAQREHLPAGEQRVRKTGIHRALTWMQSSEPDVERGNEVTSLLGILGLVMRKWFFSASYLLFILILINSVWIENV